MKDYIVKTTKSLRAEWNGRNTLYSLRKDFQVLLVFIWLNGNTGVVDDLPRSRNSKKRKIPHRQGKKVSSEWRLFSKMNYYLSFFMLSNRIQVPRTQRTCERVLRKLMLLSLTVCKKVDNLNFLPQTRNKFVLLVILTWSGVRSCSIILQTRHERRHFPPSAWETGKESSLGQRVKTMVTVDWRAANRKFESVEFLSEIEKTMTWKILYIVDNVYKGFRYISFVSRLSHDIDRDSSTAYCRVFIRR